MGHVGGLFDRLIFFRVIAGRVFTSAPKGIVIIVFALLAASGTRADNNSSENDAGAALEVGPARVGQPTLVHWRFKNHIDPAPSRVLLSLAIVHLEKAKTVFEVERIPVPGEFAMNFQFTDGAEYRLVAIGEEAGSTPIRSEKIIAATALEPPTKAMIPAFGYFIGLIALGLIAGRWSKRRGGR